MEAPRGAREPTGTNGPTPHQPPQPPEPDHAPTAPSPEGTRTGRPDTKERGRRNHYTNHDQPTPHPTHHTAGQDTPPHGGPTRGGRTTQACGGHSTGETPSNIPNLEAKPGRANGTAPQGVWESRKPPQHTTPGGPRTQARPPHTHPHARQTSRRTHTHTRQRDHARAPPARTQHRPRQHASATSAHEPHPRATTRTRASYCARPPSGLRLFMFQQSSGR